MNDLSLNMGQSQILQIHQNSVVWPHRPPPLPPDNATVMFHGAHSHRQIFNAPTTVANPTPPGRVSWKGKDFKFDKRSEFGRKDPIPGPGYKHPGQLDPQAQNRLKNRRFHRKNKFESRYAPFAPRNTTSFLIQSKKSRGNVTPCPMTPAVLPTPILSPLSEFWIDMAKEEWGVDGYGSMKGLIRLRSGSPRGDDEGGEEEEDEDDDDGGAGGGVGGSSDSDVEERVEVEKRLDHDLSRFEMIYPNLGTDDQTSVLENRVDEQDSLIARLEGENMTLKEKLYLMEREMDELRRRVQYLETDGGWRACRGQIGKNEVFSEQSVGNVNGEEDEENDNGGATTTYCGKLSVH
ncbi:hypothetical protein QN277_010297 [Acacia crassicarpa]|uniref:PRLI-interacting factor A n=1 Tax=Acacia crassicarpa TaxID=499986 RepID=A0AAE1IQL8_9FABA|nr:hypothetical protein QN277_010297 [Acacia crassicarpa]